MTAAEARAQTNVANGKDFDHEAQMTDIMSRVDTASKEGLHAIMVENLSDQNSKELISLGYKLSWDSAVKNASVKW